MRPGIPYVFYVAGLCAAPGLAATDTAPAATVESWQTLGLMRIRDMTPFGISRLDMLPAHAVPATPGTFALEASFSYQNTWALSENVRDYLTARGIRRGAIGAEEIAAILELPGDAYLVDGEFGLVDLTMHYRATRHLGLYSTIPYFVFHGGFLDGIIEGFHEEVGFASASREFVQRDRFLAIVDLTGTRIVVEHLPEDGFGDPIVGVRYSAVPRPDRFNLVVEAAVKLALLDRKRFFSTGAEDLGLQISFQRFLRRNALYLTLAAVYYQSPDPGLTDDGWIPTATAGWEGRISRHTNFIIQAYSSRSTVQRPISTSSRRPRPRPRSVSSGSTAATCCASASPITSPTSTTPPTWASISPWRGSSLARADSAPQLARLPRPGR